MRRRPRAHQVRRGIALGVSLLVVLAATPTLAAFTGSIVAGGSSNAGSTVLTTTPSGGGTCYSTGGTNTPFTSNSASCAGSVWPGTELSSGASASLATTFASVGTIAPTAATVANAGAGTEVGADVSGAGDDAYPLGGVTFGASGPLSAAAVSLDGSTGVLETEQAINDPAANLTLAAWFKVANGYASGGGIIQFQNVQSHYAGGSNDRKVWMDNAGHICSGVYNGAVDVGCSTTTYNNAGWHYVVASYSSTSGLTLYVDGSSVATNASATAGQNYVGYWTIGFTYAPGWPSAPSSDYLNGSLAEVSVFPSSLSAGQVTTLYGGGAEARRASRPACRPTFRPPTGRCSRRRAPRTSRTSALCPTSPEAMISARRRAARRRPITGRSAPTAPPSSTAPARVGSRPRPTSRR